MGPWKPNEPAAIDAAAEVPTPAVVAATQDADPAPVLRGVKTVSRFVRRITFEPPDWAGNASAFQPAAGSDASLPPPPLFSPTHARAILGAMFATFHDGPELDVARTTALLAEGRRLDAIPYVQTPTLRRGAQVLVDRAQALDPLRDDVRQVLADVERLFGRGRIEVLHFAHCPSARYAVRGVSATQRGRPVPWRPPGRGVPVLILSDFTLSAVVERRRRLRDARRVAGIRPRCAGRAMSSGWPRSVPAGSLAARAGPVDQLRALERAHHRAPVDARPARGQAIGREDSMTSVVNPRLSLLDAESPGAGRLAELASLAVRIDAGLLRRLRQVLLPDADVGVESDLWFSAIVESRSETGFQIAPEIAAQLRDRLVALPDRPAVGAVRAILAQAHAAVSPAIRLEEEVNGIAMEFGGAGRQQIDDALRPALATLAHGDADATDVARWAVHAVPRMHPVARDTTNARTLILSASMLIRRRARFTGTSAADDRISALGWALPASTQSQRIGVEFVPGGVQFGKPSETAGFIDAPLTEPVIVEIEMGIRERTAPAPGPGLPRRAGRARRRSRRSHRHDAAGRSVPGDCARG